MCNTPRTFGLYITHICSSYTMAKRYLPGTYAQAQEPNPEQ